MRPINWLLIALLLHPLDAVEALSIAIELIPIEDGSLANRVEGDVFAITGPYGSVQYVLHRFVNQRAMLVRCCTGISQSKCQ